MAGDEWWLVREQSLWRWWEDSLDTESQMMQSVDTEEERERMLGDVVDWLGETCSSAVKGAAEPTFSSPWAGLWYYLH